LLLQSARDLLQPVRVQNITAARGCKTGRVQQPRCSHRPQQSLALPALTRDKHGVCKQSGPRSIFHTDHTPARSPPQPPQPAAEEGKGKLLSWAATEGAAQPHTALLWTARQQGGGPRVIGSKHGEGTATGEAGL